MAAKCYWCEDGVTGSVPMPIGSLKEPLGTCLQCGVLVCGHHSERDSSKQELRCFDCLFIALVKSSVASSNLSSLQKQKFVEFDGLFFNNDFFAGDHDTYKSFEEFEEGNRDIKLWAEKAEIIDISIGMPSELDAIVKNINPDAKKFLAMAGLIKSNITKGHGTKRARGVETAKIVSPKMSPFIEALRKAIKTNTEND